MLHLLQNLKGFLVPPLKRIKRLMECSPFPSKTKETSSFTLYQIELYNAFFKSNYTPEINPAVLKSCRLSSKSVSPVKNSDIRHDGSGAKYGTLVGVGLPPGRVKEGSCWDTVQGISTNKLQRLSEFR